MASQFPGPPSREVHTSFEGWDNVTFRWGDDRAVRLPRLAAAAPLLRIEQRWLPVLAPDWSFAAPVPVYCGTPDLGYPWHWSVVPWIQGERATIAPLDAVGRRSLGCALAELHASAPFDAPVCPWRGTPLAARRADFLSRSGALADAHVDAEAALARYDTGAALPTPGPVWTHQDLHGDNIVTMGGDLAGILDWGELSASDHAADLGQAWALVGRDGLDDVLSGYGRALDVDDMARIAAHACDAATRLLVDGHAHHALAARRALVELGLAS